jgi:hypothetical protein
VEWLKQERLECPIKLESAYALKLGQNGTPLASLPIVGERIPFTNVTHQFVDTLDYIFFDKQFLAPTELFYVPTSFVELCGDRTHLENAHLLPSDVWPSDHLAIGARLVFRRPGGDADFIGNSQVMSTIDHKVSTPLSQVINSEANPAASDDGDAAYPYCVPIGIEGSLPPPSRLPPVQPAVTHKSRCGCGCVPSIPSLFEMAEKRKQAKLEKRRLA